jgi:histidinol phosphatase-like PHP family hydrolase
MQLPDLHIHTTMSDGLVDLKKVIRLAKRRKIIIGICDHISVYHQIYDDIVFNDYVAELRKYEVFASGELDINDTIPVSEDNLKHLDYISAGVHHFKDKKGNEHYYFSGYPASDPGYVVEDYLNKMEVFLDRYDVDILVHPTLLPPQLAGYYDDLWNDNRVERLINCTLDSDTALEISGHWRLPSKPILEYALDRGSRFATGSDSHRRSNLFDLEYPARMVTEIGIPSDRIFIPERKRTPG